MLYFKKRALQLIVPLLILFTSAKGQVTVSVGHNAQDLAQALVGQGVIVLNPTYNNAPLSAMGKFNFRGNKSDIGIDSGIVLTNGRADYIPRQALFTANFNFNGPGDTDLDNLLYSYSLYAGPTHDACILEFDFVPAGDTVQFNYVFASDEYPVYNCSWWNDVFGFFISGPGIQGARNMALIPGTDIPVAINSVNDEPNAGIYCTSMGTGAPFSQYFVNNLNNYGQHIIYNGFTTVFTASSAVIPCDTYHLKLAIADVSDHFLDSGVFLKAGSFISNKVTVHSKSTYGHNDFITDHCIRGCKPGQIIFERPYPYPYPTTIHYSIGGTAQIGVDYQTIPNSITIPAYQDTAILNIYALQRPATGPRTVKISTLNPFACSLTPYDDSTVLTIYDSLFAWLPDSSVTICPNDEITIKGMIDTTLQYQWYPKAQIPDPLPLGLTIHPKPDESTTFTLTVTMPGAPATCSPVSRRFPVIVEQKAQIAPIDTVVCLAEDSLALHLDVSPKGLDYLYTWLPARYLRSNNAKDNMFYAGQGDYHFTVIAVSPVAHCVDSGTVDIHVKPSFRIDWVDPVDTTIRYGDEVQLNSHSRAVSWHWRPPTSLSNPEIENPVANPKENILYTLVATDEYGCKDSAWVRINVTYTPNFFVPNAFSPNGDGLNDYFRIENLEYATIRMFHVYNRYGQLVYGGGNQGVGWDGSFNGKPCDVGTYYYYIKLLLPLGKEVALKGDVSLLR